MLSVGDVGEVIELIGIDLGPSSQSRAGKVIQSVVNSAAAGNLTAVRCLLERRTIGIQAERQVWEGGYQALARARPDLIDRYNQLKANVPQIDHTGPESAAQSALGRPYYGPANNTITTPGGGSSSQGGSVQLSPERNWLDALLDTLGLGPSRQDELAAGAGAAAAQQLSRTIVALGTAAVIVIVLVLFLRRR